MAEPPNEPNRTRIVALNSYWYGLDLALGFIAALATSIPLARVIGPEKLGYFNFTMWLVSMSGVIGSLGIPATTRKFMAEYVGRGEQGIARAVFYTTFKLQISMGLLVTGVGLVILFLFGDPSHRLVSAIQILSVLPAMAGYVPAQANAARENLKANVAGSVLSTIIYIAAVLCSLTLGWGLVGVASGFLLGRTVELCVRTGPVVRWIRTLPPGTLPLDLGRQMRLFSLQGTGLLLLTVLLWNRSDMILLKALNRSLSELSFFSIAFNITAQVMVLPHVFSGALGATMMVEYGRDRDRVGKMACTAAKYILLCSAPLFLGAVFLSSVIVQTLYGSQYQAAIPALAISAAFGLFIPHLAPAQNLLQSHGRQAGLLILTCLGGGLNVVLDCLLIPKWGATGAALGNGIGQSLAVLAIWALAIRTFNLKLDFGSMVRILGAALAMGIPVVAISRAVAAPVALVVGPFAGAAIYCLVLRITRALNEQDIARLLELRHTLPRPLGWVGGLLARWVAA